LTQTAINERTKIFADYFLGGGNKPDFSDSMLTAERIFAFVKVYN